MIGRAVINAGRLVATRRAPVALQMTRNVHKGIEGAPPMRFMSVPERVGLYLFIAITFLSYPTFVMYNLDNLRPPGENELGESAIAERDRRLAERH